jgi:hypothetical protein
MHRAEPSSAVQAAAWERLWRRLLRPIPPSLNESVPEEQSERSTVEKAGEGDTQPTKSSVRCEVV